MSWWNRCWRSGEGKGREGGWGEVSAGARGRGGARRGKLTTRARFGFFAAPCCCDGPGPSLRPWRVSCRRALVVVAAVAVRPELLDVLVPQQRELLVARRGGPERHLCAIQHLAPRALERERGDAPHAPHASHVEEPAVAEASRPDLSSLEASRLPPATAAARAAIAARAAARTATMVWRQNFWRVPWHS